MTHRNTKGGRNGTKSVGGRNRRSKAVHARCDRAVERDTRREGKAEAQAQALDTPMNTLPGIGSVVHWTRCVVTRHTPSLPSPLGIGYPFKVSYSGLVMDRGRTDGGTGWVRVLHGGCVLLRTTESLA